MTNRVENAKDLSAEQVSEITALVKQALTETPDFQQLNGCARVYMHIGYSKIMKGYPIVKALNNVGPIRVTSRPGEKGVTFYMGYDNAHGGVHSVANHVAKKLKDMGYIAYTDCDGD